MAATPPPAAPSTHASSTTNEHATDTQTTTPTIANPNDRTILIGLSGPSSSGKTTIARLLAQIFTHAPPPSPPPAPAPPRRFRSSSLHILHQDDFYLTDADVPLTRTAASCASGLGARELLDWDCASSLDVPLLAETLGFVKRCGKLPAGAVSKEDLNSVGPVDVREGVVREVRGRVGAWVGGVVGVREGRDKGYGEGEGEGVAEGTGETKGGGKGRGEGTLTIWIVDGFLLYPPPPSPAAASAQQKTPPPPPPAAPPHLTPGEDAPSDVRLKDQLHATVTSLLDIKLLLLSSRDATIARRTRRTGYVTLEGFWEDPPGYVEDVVWPNYVRDARWLMRRGGVEGEADEDPMVHVDEAVAASEGISFVPGRGGADLSEVLVWAAEEVMRGVERVPGGGGEGSVNLDGERRGWETMGLMSGRVTG